MTIRIMVGILSMGVAGIGCTGSGSGSAPAAASAAAATSTASIVTPEKTANATAPVATPSATAPVATPNAGTPPPALVAVAPETAAPVAARVATVDPETARKTAQIEWALKQDEIKQDPKGQWASQAKSSSALNDAQGSAFFAPNQAAGPANVERYGSNGSAWSPKMPDGGIEWLELTYAKPVHATAVRVRESYGSGAIIKVELFDEKGTAHTVWSGTDPTTELNYFAVEFPKTLYKTGRVKLTLATNIVNGWNQIDAVQLVGTDQ